MTSDRLAFTKETLENGITLWTHETDVPFTHVRIVIPVGSVHSHNGNYGGALGVAHFLEHMLMERSLRYPEKGSFERTLSQCGGDWNACTTPFYTDFFLHAPATDIEELVRGLMSHVYEPQFAPEDIEVQRGIVQNERELDKYYPGATEIDRYKFDSWMHTRFYSKEQLFGTDASLAAFTPEKLLSFHEHYHTRESQIFIGGTITPALRNILESIQTHDTTPLVPSVEEARWEKQEFHSATSKDLDTPLFSWGGIFPVSDMHDFWTITLVADMLTNQNEGILTDWIRKEKGWSYSVSSAQWFDRDRMAWTIDTPVVGSQVIPELRSSLHEKVRHALNSENLLKKTTERILKSNCFSFQRLTERMDFAVEYRMSFGVVPTEAEYATWLRSMTPANLLEAYEKYFSPRQTGEVLLVPE